MLPMKLAAHDLTLGYRGAAVVHDVSLEIEPGSFVAVIGPNGSGKSTLLRGLSRLLRPQRGRVLLDGRDIRSMGAREVARLLAVLPQSPDGGLDLTVRELVWRGRYPHRALLRGATPADYEAVDWALGAADVTELVDRPLDSLSGGERQRAWIALALAQQPRVLLLDEPTAFLDLKHQLDVMALLDRLHRQGITVVVVVHDLALAARYARRVVALRGGRVVLDGAPGEVLTPSALESVFDVPMQIVMDPETGLPIPIPRALPAGAAQAAPSGAGTP
jgi:iron complex transport system ATP-binding protein